jgi:hypothetical protein
MQEGVRSMLEVVVPDAPPADEIGA